MVSLPTVKTPGVIRSVGEVEVEVAGLLVGLLPVGDVVVLLLPHAASSRDSTTILPSSKIASEERRPRFLKNTAIIQIYSSKKVAGCEVRLSVAQPLKR